MKRLTFKLCFLQLFLCLNSNRVIDCIKNIIEPINEQDRYVFLYKDQDIADEILKNQNMFVVVNLDYDFEEVKRFEQFNFYLINVKNFNDIEYVFANMWRQRMWNPKGKFLLLYNGKEYEEIFQLSWQYYLLNLSILTSTGEIITYFPYNRTGCSINFSPISLQCERAFLEKYPKSYNSCPINVAPIRYDPEVNDWNDKNEPGYEILLLRALSKHLDFTINYLKHNYTYWGRFFDNGTLTGFYKYAADGYADFLVGAVIIIANTPWVDLSTAHGLTAVSFCVPTAQKMPTWRNLILSFNWALCTVLLTSFALVGFVIWMIAKIQKSKEVFADIFQSYFYVWCAFANCTNVMPTADDIRIAFIFWCFESYFISLFLQALITSLLTNSVYMHQITTYEEMVESNLKWGGFSVLKMYLYRPESHVYMKMYQGFVDSGLSITNFPDRTAYQRDFAMARDIRQMNYLISKRYTTKEGTSLIFCIDESILTATMHWVFTRGFPFFDRINDKIISLKEAGMIFKWDKYERMTYAIKSKQEFASLTLEHFGFVFIIFAVGNIVAFFVLLLEIVISRRNKFKQH